MVIFGHRATKTGHQSLFGTTCQHCGTKNTLEMYTFSRYFHVFWIPCFPYRKEAVTQCNHCKQVLHKKEFSADLLQSYEEMKANTKTPYWQFIGAVLFSVLIISVVLSIQEDNKKDNLYLGNPAVGDVYEIRTPTNQYTLYKVSKIVNDSIYVAINEYETNKLSGLEKAEMNSPSSFIEDELISLSIKQLTSMKGDGTIHRVRRKNSISQ